MSNTPQEVAESLPGTGMGGMVSQNLPAAPAAPEEPPVNRSEAEAEAGTAFAEMNAAKQEKAAQSRADERRDTIKMAADARRAVDEDNAKRAEAIEGLVPEDGVPPAGPGLPRPTRAAMMATMDPNNPVLNPDGVDAARLASRSLPPGARVPEPVLPADSAETQYASKPLTEAHAAAGVENLGAVTPSDNLALTNEPMGGGAGAPAGEPAPAPAYPQQQPVA
jgi:hypothetical protein